MSISITPESLGYPRIDPPPIALAGDASFCNAIYPARNLAWTTAGSAFGTGLAPTTVQVRPYGTDPVTTAASQPPAYTNGVLCVTLPPVTGFPAIFEEFRWNWRGRTDKTKIGAPQQYNAGRVLRVIYIGAFVGGVGTAVQDIGFELLGTVPNHGILANTLPGLGIILDTDGTMKFIVQGAGLTKFAIPIPGFDRTQFHAYEFRCTASSAAQDGSVEFWCDGIQLYRLLWGTGTILPTLTDNGGLYGTILNYANAGQCTISTERVHWIMGNQLADVL